MIANYMLLYWPVKSVAVTDRNIAGCKIRLGHQFGAMYAVFVYVNFRMIAEFCNPIPNLLLKLIAVITKYQQTCNNHYMILNFYRYFEDISHTKSPALHLKTFIENYFLEIKLCHFFLNLKHSFSLTG